MTSGELLLSVRNLRTTFPTDAGPVRAVDGVSFDVRRGEVLSVVGESGSGKSVTAMSVLRLLPESARIEADSILWKGEELQGADDARMQRLRGGEIAMIFQDPLSALNPVHRVGRQIAEMVRIHKGIDKKAASARAVELLDLVGIPQAARRATMYPHEFSGGMRQRAMIAMAIACDPSLLIADEPTTALDVTVQAQVLEVLVGLKDEIDSAIVLITHDLGVVAGLSDRVMVMYGGKQVELGTTDEVFYRTRHPYTLGLLASLPRLDDVGHEPLVPIAGAPPSLLRLPPGCAFHPRCPLARPACRESVPELRSVDGATAHASACHFAEEVVSVGELRAEVSLDGLPEEVAEGLAVETVDGTVVEAPDEPDPVDEEDLA
ncbi:MAG: ABC transporter ATP-binding protein [Acidimicrobiales bacterium]|jgi:oligopeptide/dipeptide ABC transporter ATP-binding protein|nr:ABC transporter ATP-binding protein [Acidimicrobiales bacterium]